MAKYVCILRGINVGGRRKILMADLKSLMTDLGFLNVQTYIQSGNVLFETKRKKDHKQMEQRIANAINEQYGFDVPVIIRTDEELKAIAENNPFLKEKKWEIERLHLTFLGETPSIENIAKSKEYDSSPDRFVIVRNNVFVFCNGRYSETKLTNTFFEKKLKLKATTRNWKTILKIYELLGKTI